MKSLTIGKLARASRVNIETIRFYERKGLLPNPPRSESGYRQFPEETLERVRFIRNAKELGFTLKEISELLSLRLVPNSTCEDVKKKAREKMREVEAKIKHLELIKTALSDLTAMCSKGPPASECHFLEVLSSNSA